jgi:hypothetical protein
MSAMQLNDSFFSFPPYLSAPWDQVSALAMNPSGRIECHLMNGDVITLPELTVEQTELIFKAHAANLKKSNPFPDPQFPFKIGIAAEGLAAPLQHNPKAGATPELPPDIILKIAQATKMLLPKEHLEDIKPEPKCLCSFCQIAALIHAPEEILFEGEPVSDQELCFEQWEIKQTGEKLYCVTNKLDSHETYSVHLGNPIGCTCGKENCDHILSVLKS